MKKVILVVLFTTSIAVFASDASATTRSRSKTINEQWIAGSEVKTVYKQNNFNNGINHKYKKIKIVDCGYTETIIEKTDSHGRPQKPVSSYQATSAVNCELVTGYPTLISSSVSLDEVRVEGSKVITLKKQTNYSNGVETWTVDETTEDCGLIQTFHQHTDQFGRPQEAVRNEQGTNTTNCGNRTHYPVSSRTSGNVLEQVLRGVLNEIVLR